MFVPLEHFLKIIPLAVDAFEMLPQHLTVEGVIFELGNVLSVLRNGSERLAHEGALGFPSPDRQLFICLYGPFVFASHEAFPDGSVFENGSELREVGWRVLSAHQIQVELSTERPMYTGTPDKPNEFGGAILATTAIKMIGRQRDHAEPGSKRWA